MYSLVNICSINDPDGVVGSASSDKSGDEELGQRGENPDFASSLCLSTPSPLGLLPRVEQTGVRGRPKG